MVSKVANFSIDLPEATVDVQVSVLFTQSIAVAEAAAETLLPSGLTAEATHSGLGPATRRAVLVRVAA